ncbi:MAG TPA: DUF3365 domain-containing protein [Oscillatoriales cyanobacterium M59_W2019_021]|nr:DUF3365 domain-containing protein [Oscillatoriales cyanobacterium M4454_W2019_049]HIK49392.1 DUF3365 domain-containing protein [Oscillatoriales cyanobacterium M59_W2019_021]
MLRLCWRLLLGFAIILGLFFVRVPMAIAQIQPSELSQVVREIELIDTLRSTLSSNFKDTKSKLNSEPEVCQLIAQKLDRLSCNHDWQVKQIASQYRNPENAPISSREKLALEKFANNSELVGFWERDRQGIRYFQRIDLEASCLACHGAKHKRPPFIPKNYPHDLAYDFQEGDLAGMYSVWIPQQKGTIQDVIPDRHFCRRIGQYLAMQSHQSSP